VLDTSPSAPSFVKWLANHIEVLVEKLPQGGLVVSWQDDMVQLCSYIVCRVWGFARYFCVPIC